MVLTINMRMSRTFFCITALIASSHSLDNFKISPHTTSSGLYYEKIGDVLLSNSRWQFITSVDYEGYLRFYTYLFTQVKKIEKFCSIINITKCSDRYRALTSSLQAIFKNHEAISNLLEIPNQKRRVKRFWTNALTAVAPHVIEPLVGSLKKIFGGDMDEAELKQIYEDINHLEGSQNQLRSKVNELSTVFKIDSKNKNYQIQMLERTGNYIKNRINTFQNITSRDRKLITYLKEKMTQTEEQVKLLETSQTTLQKGVSMIHEEIKTINNNMDYVFETINKTHEKIDSLETESILDSILLDFDILLMQFETEQRELLDIIRNAEAGKAEQNSRILSLETLMQVLTDMQSEIPEDVKFPFHIGKNDVKIAYKLIKSTVYLYQSRIIFMFSIPLVNSKTFSLYKMTSFPSHIEANKFGFILPKRPYLLIDKNSIEYTLLSYENFQFHCQHIKDNTHLCDQVQHNSMTSQSMSECEVQLFLYQKILDTCIKRIVSLERDLFIQLMEFGAWIYAVPDRETVIDNLCTREQVSISGTGILRSGGCSLRTPDVSLSTLRKFSRTVTEKLFPNVNLKDFVDSDDTQQQEEKLQGNTQVISPFAYDDLKEISRESKHGLNGNTGGTGMYAAAVLGCLLMLLIVFFLVMFLRGREIIPFFNDSMGAPTAMPEVIIEEGNPY